MPHNPHKEVINTLRKLINKTGKLLYHSDKLFFFSLGGWLFCPSSIASLALLASTAIFGLLYAISAIIGYFFKL